VEGLDDLRQQASEAGAIHACLHHWFQLVAVVNVLVEVTVPVSHN
jgi:hypothetical protein